jgi:hypothetical protein
MWLTMALKVRLKISLSELAQEAKGESISRHNNIWLALELGRS